MVKVNAFDVRGMIITDDKLSEGEFFEKFSKILEDN